MSETDHIIRSKAIEAKCHDCMGEYADGLMDCRVVICPLYTFMPYREQEPCTEWTKWSHRRIGKNMKKPATEQQLESIRRANEARKNQRDIP